MVMGGFLQVPRIGTGTDEDPTRADTPCVRWVCVNPEEIAENPDVDYIIRLLD